VLEELGLPYEAIFLEFGKAPDGVEGPEFLKKNPAGRVPLIYDPATDKRNYLLICAIHVPQALSLTGSISISLTESNTIAKYLVDHYKKDNNLFIRSVPEEYILLQWLHFQGATQGTIFQQV
jgi:glutathione S-transferase